MIYNVYYPNGAIKKHFVNDEDKNYFPALEKVFYNRKSYYDNITYFQIVEIGEEDVWVEPITGKKYYEILNKFNINQYVMFKLNEHGSRLAEF